MRQIFNLLFAMWVLPAFGKFAVETKDLETKLGGIEAELKKFIEKHAE